MPRTCICIRPQTRNWTNADVHIWPLPLKQISLETNDSACDAASVLYATFLLLPLFDILPRSLRGVWVTIKRRNLSFRFEAVMLISCNRSSTLFRLWSWERFQDEYVIHVCLTACNILEFIAPGSVENLWSESNSGINANFKFVIAVFIHYRTVDTLCRSFSF